MEFLDRKSNKEQKTLHGKASHSLSVHSVHGKGEAIKKILGEVLIDNALGFNKWLNSKILSRKTLRGKNCLLSDFQNVQAKHI